MNKKQATEKAITLIALIVTIVVMLILVGVTINVAFREDGIIAQAKMAAFKTEMSQIKENVDIKKTQIVAEQITSNNTVKLFDETLEQRSDIKVPDTFKQEVMYLRDSKPEDKSQSDYEVENFNISGLLVIDEQTGNGKKDTYAYDEITGIVLKIPQTKIGGKAYHSLEGKGGDQVQSSTIQDEAGVVNVDDEYYYEPDLKGFDGKNTEIVYYSSDFTKQITKNAQEYINEGKQNTITESGIEYQFYNYKNERWANIKTTAQGLENWWIWIPRYAYKVNGTSNTDEPIGVIYIGLDNKPLNPKYDGVLPEGYEVHPAFTPSGEDGSKNLKGIWFSKFEPNYAQQVPNENVLAPDMNGFDKDNTYIELYDSTTNTFSREVKLSGADLSSVNNSKEWYDYSKQQYANIKTTAQGLENWWVWIPRYAYRKTAENSSKQIMEVIFVGMDDKPLDKARYPKGLPEGYEVHPAFTPSGEDGSKNLQGIWFSKYEPNYAQQVPNNNVLAPDMNGFDKDNTYIELYDSTTNTFSREIKLSEADLSTVNNSKEWYDYSKQQYANIKTMANGAENWWVWIPRYAYRKTAENSTKQIMEIIFVDTDNKPLDKARYPNGLPEGYEVHPAFTPSGEDGSKNLQGIWFSKYEPSQK